ncbi:MAG: hypothetical protein JST00_05140 [Deltaproteobacteria bacterium]|nr:hypothetical protein [Deltaproteobacteria bacterium]
MIDRRARAVLVASLSVAIGGCGLLFDFGDYDASRSAPSSDGGPAAEADLVPPDAFVLAVEPGSVSGTTRERIPIRLRVRRGERFTGEVSFEIATGDVTLDAPPVPSGAAESSGVVIPGATHGPRDVTIVGTSPGGVKATATLRVDVRGLPGALDTTFGTGGIVEIASLTAAADVAIGDDDAVVLAAREGSGTSKDALLLARLTSAGTLDPSFGTGGRAVVVPANGGEGEGTQCVARGPAPGGFLVGGTNGPKRALAVAAVDRDGKLVTSFGPDGTGVLSLGQASCRSLTIASGGALWIAASTFLERRTSTGASDTAWGDGGTVDFSGIGEALSGVLPDDAGAARAYGTFTSWPIGADGSRGTSTPHAPKTTGACLQSVRPAAAPDGRAAIGGACGSLVSGGGESIPIVGVLVDGRPATDFADQGFVRGPNPGYASALVAAAGGVVRVSGTADPDRLSVVMYDAKGAERWTFTAGAIPLLANATARAAAVDSRGRIVVVGVRNIPGTGTTLLALRLWS